MKVPISLLLYKIKQKTTLLSAEFHRIFLLDIRSFLIKQKRIKNILLLLATPRYHIL